MLVVGVFGGGNRVFLREGALGRWSGDLSTGIWAIGPNYPSKAFCYF